MKNMYIFQSCFKYAGVNVNLDSSEQFKTDGKRPQLQKWVERLRFGIGDAKATISQAAAAAVAVAALSSSALDPSLHIRPVL